jgi:S1-C subfamily serine protease
MPTDDRPFRPARAPTTGINWLVIILLILVTGLLWRERGGGAFSERSRLRDPKAQERPITARGDLAEDEKSTIALFKQAAPSVVHITNLAVRRDLNMDIFGIPQGTGTGFIWDRKGYVVTNFHVIEHANAAKVMLADRSEWDASLVGVARDQDVAVLKIEAPEEKLPAILVGESANLEVGQKVFAIGNPFGLDQTLTTGVVSGLGREILSVTKRPIQGVIQTDAAINPGNSGGPLLDSAGRLIGINTAIPAEVSAGIGFAVPVDTVQRIVPQIIKYGRAERIGLGIARGAGPRRHRGGTGRESRNSTDPQRQWRNASGRPDPGGEWQASERYARSVSDPGSIQGRRCGDADDSPQRERNEGRRHAGGPGMNCSPG